LNDFWNGKYCEGGIGMKVLAVDDSSTMRRILTNCLGEIGYKDVLQAADGIEALHVLSKEKDIGLILVDWHMPNMDGFMLLQEIKKNAETTHIPVIMVTTQAEKQSVEEALKSGAVSYIMKPFTPEMLKQKIAELVRM